MPDLNCLGLSLKFFIFCGRLLIVLYQLSGLLSDIVINLMEAGFVFCPHLLRHHGCSSTHSYIDFPGLVEIAGERKHGTSLHSQRKCSQASCSVSYHDLGDQLSKAVTHEQAPL
jgi:hypothetical protein